MAKRQKCITVGNSFAITLSRHTCRLLRIDRTTEFSVTIEDKNTILLRPVRSADRAGQPDRFRLYKTLVALAQQYGMGDQEFQPLSHDGRTWRTFLLDAQVGGHADLTTVERLQLCLQLRSDAVRRREDVPWEATIATVLEAFPDRPAASPPATEDPALDGTLLSGVPLSSP